MARATLCPLSRLLLISGVCALAIVASPGDAQAQQGPFVAWEAPAGCPGREAFSRALIEHLGGQPKEALHVEVRITRRGKRYRLEMHTTSAENTGDRVLTDRDCKVLVETAALTLALAIDPEAEPRGAERWHDPENPPVPQGRPADASWTPPTLPRRELGVALSARAQLSADHGSFPGTAPGAGLALATHLNAWRIEAYAAYWPEQRAAIEGDPADGAELSSLVGGLRGCLRILGSRMTTDLCGGGELSRTTGRGFGGFDSQSGSWVWLSLAGGPSFGLKILERLTVRVDLEVVGRPFRRPEFAFLDVDPAVGLDVVHTPSWVAGRASAGLEVSFP